MTKSIIKRFAVLGMAISVLLTACAQEPSATNEPDTDNPSFEGITLTVGTTLLTDAGGSEWMEQLDLITVHLPEDEAAPPAGSIVSYTIRPEIMESYPPQANAISMEIVSEESEPILIPLELAGSIKMHQPEDTYILDVRTPAEFAEGHVVDAINLPVDELQQRLPDYDLDDTLIVYCRSGNRSQTAADLLDEGGFKVVLDAGGIQGYTSETVVP